MILVKKLFEEYSLILQITGLVKEIGTKEEIETSGLAACFIPAYSPECAVIEKLFAEVKKAVSKMSDGRRVDFQGVSGAEVIFSAIESCSRQEVAALWTHQVKFAAQSIQRSDYLFHK